MRKVCFEIESLYQTKKLAQFFAKLVENGACVSLFGDIGAGKTTFAKNVFLALGVKESISSPSFVILNEYKTGKVPIYHFDLYRLENEGVKSIAYQLCEYSLSKALTMIEWAQFSNLQSEIETLNLNIVYIDETRRRFEFSSVYEQYDYILKSLKEVKL